MSLIRFLQTTSLSTQNNNKGTNGRERRWETVLCWGSISLCKSIKWELTMEKKHFPLFAIVEGDFSRCAICERWKDSRNNVQHHEFCCLWWWLILQFFHSNFLCLLRSTFMETFHLSMFADSVQQVERWRNFTWNFYANNFFKTAIYYGDKIPFS